MITFDITDALRNTLRDLNAAVISLKFALIHLVYLTPFSFAKNITTEIILLWQHG